MRTGRTHRVCLFFPGLGLGGAEKQIASYMRHRPTNVKVTVLYLDNRFDGSPDSMVEAFSEYGATVRHVPMGRANPLAVLQLSRVIRELQPDILHTFLSGSAGTWGRLAGVVAGVKHIFHSDRSLNPPLSRSQKLLRPWLHKRTRRFLPNAEAIADWLLSEGVPQERIRVVQNGVNLERFQPDQVNDLRGPLGIPVESMVAGFLGKFRPEKRLDLLLDAVSQVPVDKRPDYLLLGGDGPTMPEVRRQIQMDPWLRERCVLVGLVKDVPAFMNTIDYLVLSSDREGLPNVVLEAMAMEKPIVATKVAEVPLIAEGVSFLCQTGSSVGLSNAWAAMQTLSANDRKAMGKAARERVLAHWDIRQAAHRFWDLHLEVLQ